MDYSDIQTIEHDVLVVGAGALVFGRPLNVPIRALVRGLYLNLY